MFQPVKRRALYVAGIACGSLCLSCGTVRVQTYGGDPLDDSDVALVVTSSAYPSIEEIDGSTVDNGFATFEYAVTPGDHQLLGRFLVEGFNRYDFACDIPFTAEAGKMYLLREVLLDRGATLVLQEFRYRKEGESCEYRLCEGAAVAQCATFR